MEKIIYLIWGDGQRPQEPSFENDIVADVGSAVGSVDVRGVSVHAAKQEIVSQWLQRTAPPPESLWAMVSVWVDDIIQRGSFEAELANLGAPRVDGYLVTESVPRWRPGPADGAKSAGVQLLSILHRPDGMTHDAFVDHWIESHLPLSLSTHPQWTYVRNIITRPLNDGAKPFDAVCEHGFEKPEHLTDPRYFYRAGNDAEKLAENVAIIRADAAKFVDNERSGLQTTVEHVLKSAFSPRALPGFDYAGPVDMSGG